MRLTLNPQGRCARIVLCLVVMTGLMLFLLFGYVTVTKNCYNAMNEVPITVFAVTETDSGEKSVVFLNKTIFEW